MCKNKNCGCGDNCVKSQLYQFCKNDEPEECCENKSEGIQLDMKQVFYKMDDECFSNLDALSIPKGADLEYTVERLAQLIENFTFVNLEPNKYGSNDIKEFLDNIVEEINDLQKCYDEIKVNQQSIISELNSLKSLVKTIKYPKIDDNNALGFNKNSSIQTILQLISDNVQPNLW